MGELAAGILYDFVVTGRPLNELPIPFARRQLVAINQTAADRIGVVIPDTLRRTAHVLYD